MKLTKEQKQNQKLLNYIIENIIGSNYADFPVDFRLALEVLLKSITQFTIVYGTKGMHELSRASEMLQHDVTEITKD